MSVCVDTKLSELETALSVVMGGSTALSDPANNISDPLVQIAIHALGGLCAVETALQEFKSGFNIATASCDCLTILATLIGETQLTNKPSSVSISATGTNNTIIPAGTTYSDNFANTWTLQDQITIINGWGWGVAFSAAGSYSVNTSELLIDTAIDNVNTTNGQMIELGYLSEDCEVFRARLMSGGGASINETESGVIKRIESLGAKVSFIGDAPDCVSPFTNNAFVVNGGSDSDIANILMNYAPLNYTTLAGNVEYLVNDCETVRFLRPCPVGIEINYWGRSEIDDQEFIDALCSTPDKCKSTSITAMNFADINKLKQISIRPIYTRNSTVSSTDATTAIDCFGGVSLISDDCHCTGDIVDQPVSDCIDIESWQYPVFVSATYNGESC